MCHDPFGLCLTSMILVFANPDTVKIYDLANIIQMRLMNKVLHWGK